MKGSCAWHTHNSSPVFCDTVKCLLKCNKENFEEKLSLSIYQDVIVNQFGLFESYENDFIMGYAMSIIIAFIPSCKHAVVWCILLFKYLFLHHV